MKIWFQNRRARERRDKRIGVAHLDTEQTPAGTLLSPMRMSPSQSLAGTSSRWSPGLLSPTLCNGYATTSQQKQHDTSMMGGLGCEQYDRGKMDKVNSEPGNDAS